MVFMGEGAPKAGWLWRLLSFLFCYRLFLSNCKQTVVFPSLFIRHGAANLLHLIFINIRFLHVYGKELILQFDLSNTGRDR